MKPVLIFPEASSQILPAPHVVCDGRSLACASHMASTSVNAGQNGTALFPKEYAARKILGHKGLGSWKADPYSHGEGPRNCQDNFLLGLNSHGGVWATFGSARGTQSWEVPNSIVRLQQECERTIDITLDDGDKPEVIGCVLYSNCAQSRILEMVWNWPIYIYIYIYIYIFIYILYIFIFLYLYIFIYIFFKHVNFWLTETFH